MSMQGGLIGVWLPLVNIITYIQRLNSGKVFYTLCGARVFMNNLMP
jgi:hypothetical protein